MLVLLQANVPNLGHIGDLVKVKAGYARNYLFPRELAVLADERNKKLLDHQRRQADAKKQKDLTSAKELAATISALSLTIQKPVGEEDKIFGTVTTQELADAFRAAGHEIDRRMISILDEIKLVGVYKGVVKLHPEVSAQFNIWVVAQN
ncbi:50S ribosomal protein L9 [Pigmentibacter sp. JX0631]|uniref:50S ribosomal protein L9 n=1 Tax=Pigmentibacter sp. JX0631 TaxID=2976982 RepID=UPI002469B2C2|nr:50S ribosomal protein L9 [Pigmentibacter sp. JX0631]WGL60423.1 50S ribosomal protein L9 [Pigmentibacter sp. JX0631]